MPFAPGYTRTKNFAALGSLLPADLNAIQDDLGGAIEQRAPLAEVTALPGSPVDGQEIVYQSAGMAADGVAWRFKYNAGSGSSYKWEFIGGAPLRAIVNTDEALGAGSGYADLATVGPQITVPLAGDYDVGFSAVVYQAASATLGSTMGITVNGAAPAVLDRVAHAISIAGQPATAMNEARIAGVSAATVFKLQYNRNASNSLNYRGRLLLVRPVRVG